MPLPRAAVLRWATVLSLALALLLLTSATAGGAEAQAKPSVPAVPPARVVPKERLVFIQLTQGASARLHSRHLFKNLVYGAVIE